jgi:pSer/pThr/pTyr-binding forkhead associated (FHA) protein
MHTCSKGHPSTEADFCSECGAKILGIGVEISSNAVAIPIANISTSTQPCPDCSTPHEADSGNFCEICGYNFLTNVSGGNPLSNFPPPIVASTPVTTAPTKPPNPPTTEPNSALSAIGDWQLIISIDPSLATPNSPPAPAQTPIVIELEQPINPIGRTDGSIAMLIGRTSAARAIHPEIPLDVDDAVSSRHAILTLHSDGRLVLRDIGSSNGTMVNGKEIAVMADMTIASGDEITLGHWTRIKLMKVV